MKEPRLWRRRPVHPRRRTRGGLTLATVITAALFAAAAAVVLAIPPHTTAAQMAPAAAPIVGQLEKAMGGADSWHRVRYLRFDWVVERDGAEVSRVQHLWDRHQNRYRVEWKTREGQAVQALFDTATRAGRIWVDGTEVLAADAAPHLERAYGRFINDTYWLLMPWKLRDPGVHVEMAGEQSMDGKTYDVLHVHFEQVGLTPGDQYWAFVDRSSGRMDRWAYFLEGDKEKGAPSLDLATSWMWSDWTPVGGILIARDRRMMGEGNRRIHFPVVATPSDVDARVFQDPKMGLPG